MTDDKTQPGVMAFLVELDALRALRSELARSELAVKGLAEDLRIMSRNNEDKSAENKRLHEELRRKHDDDKVIRQIRELKRQMAQRDEVNDALRAQIEVAERYDIRGLDFETKPGQFLAWTAIPVDGIRRLMVNGEWRTNIQAALFSLIAKLKRRGA